MSTAVFFYSFGGNSALAAQALAKKLGGQVLLEPRPDLFHGKVAVLADPTGAAVGIMEWDETQVKGGN